MSEKQPGVAQERKVTSILWCVLCTLQLALKNKLDTIQLSKNKVININLSKCDNNTCLSGSSIQYTLHFQ